MYFIRGQATRQFYDPSVIHQHLFNPAIQLVCGDFFSKSRILMFKLMLILHLLGAAIWTGGLL